MFVSKVIHRVSDIEKGSWDELHAVSEGATPFMRWTFLSALEESGSVGPKRGWYPIHLTLWNRDENTQLESLIAVAPAYIKQDSMGDFSRDYPWARSLIEAGVPYYPKLVIGVPFTPVPGRRFLIAESADRNECIRRLLDLAGSICRQNRVSSIQVLYHHSMEKDALIAQGFTGRISFQFHWNNRNYAGRDAFLSRFRSKNRNQIKREWSCPDNHGLSIQTIRGEKLQQNAAHWAAQTHRFYRETVARFMWGEPYLNGQFFQTIFSEMSDVVEVVAASDNQGKFLGGAFNINDGTTLWGRYWGGIKDIPFLHFNVCYYHSIQDCIDRSVQVFQGGEGGSHKIKRGFVPTEIAHSFKFLDPRANDAVGQYLEQEYRSRLAELETWRSEHYILRE